MQACWAEEASLKNITHLQKLLTGSVYLFICINKHPLPLSAPFLVWATAPQNVWAQPRARVYWDESNTFMQQINKCNNSTYTLENDGYVLASIVQWRIFHIHGSFPLHQRSVIVAKGMLLFTKYCSFTGEPKMIFVWNLENFFLYPLFVRM